jgi:hypothetical protein
VYGISDLAKAMRYALCHWTFAGGDGQKRGSHNDPYAIALRALGREPAKFFLEESVYAPN